MIPFRTKMDVDAMCSLSWTARVAGGGSFRITFAGGPPGSGIRMFGTSRPSLGHKICPFFSRVFQVTNPVQGKSGNHLGIPDILNRHRLQEGCFLQGWFNHHDVDESLR